jgi:PhzF family phenazine biosynthesis protein
MRTFIVDAFTNKPYTGNPAGVCILENDIPDELKGQIAREVNHSETAFVLKNQTGFKLRWFTPMAEVDLCGHATLASAHILYETGFVGENNTIEFETKSGILKAKLINEKIELDFPQLLIEQTSSNEIIENGFDIKPTYVGSNHNSYLIEINSVDELKNIKPDFQILQNSDRGRFIITVQSTDGIFDFYSRFFAPGVGVNEDPVTGSAHCSLAPYWSKKLDKKILKAFQASNRTGILECEIADNDRVFLRGQAVTMNEMAKDWPK